MEDTERCRSDQACERIRQEYASFKKEGKLLSKIKFIKENVQYVQSSPLRETFSPKLLTL